MQNEQNVCFSDIQQIVSDPVQAVSDAVDEVSSLLNKLQGTDVNSACMIQLVIFNSKYFNNWLSYLGPQNVHLI